MKNKKHPAGEGVEEQWHVRLWRVCNGRRQESAMASENCKSSHMAATILGWAARRDELKRPGHERSCAVLKTLSSTLKQWEATTGF